MATAPTGGAAGRGMCVNARPDPDVLEQVGMRADAHENDLLVRTAALQLVDEQKVAADVALAMVGPVADKCVVQPHRPKRRVVRDQRQHGFLQALHVEAARVRQTGPVLDEGLGSVRRPRQVRALIAWRPFQDRRSTLWPKRNATC